MNPNAVRILNRAADMAGSYGNARIAPERVEAEALAKLIVEHAMQELDSFIRYCYQVDEHGRWLRILPDGQIRNGVWTPWGGSGKSSLTRNQRDTLRLWLWQEKNSRRFPLFVYRPDRRRWYVDLLRNPSETDALDWLHKCGLTAKSWLGVQR